MAEPTDPTVRTRPAGHGAPAGGGDANDEAPRYDPSVVEPKWQAYWESHQTFHTPNAEDPRDKAYILDMFPYPSGAGLHAGHPEGYTATDILARFLRAKNKAVLHPMGWDAFGLPAEQHAIRTGTHPRDTTAANIRTFKRQLKMLGFSYDWEREVDTTDPDYVRWTQWIFLRLFHRGLAYQDQIAVNWCPELGTVLANEEIKDGRSEIGGFPVERVPLRQWMLRITAYADRLLSGLSDTEWPDSTRTMQREWIGRSEGAEVRFAVEGHGEVIEIFTTRPDTLFGATFMVLAPEHPLVARITRDDRRSVVDAYVAEAQAKSDLDRKAAKQKTGVSTGASAINPVNQARVPIYIADYVLMGYGTGAIMAVPGHDERDFEFAKEHGLPIIEVVSPTKDPQEAPLAKAFVGDGFAVRSGEYDGLTTADFKARIIDDLSRDGRGKRRVEYKLRDWVFSRQRYWGEPIPIYFPVETDGDPRSGAPAVIRHDQPIAVDESELPLRLPDLDDFQPGKDPAGPLARAASWRYFQRDGRWYARETNTMPQWAGSCWYYLRFMDPKNDREPFSAAAANRWLPVDLYVGGAEQAVLHLLYARFWHKVLFDEGLVPTEEPFKKLVHQGMILGEIELTRYVDRSGLPVSRTDVDVGSDGKVYRVGTREELMAERVSDADVEKNRAGDFVLKAHRDVVVDARAHKMSKSRGNVVSPDEIVTEFGADSMRVYEMFMGPLEATKPWSSRSISGVRRFLDRAYEVSRRADPAAVLTEELARSLHKTIKKVTEDIENLRLNTAISAMMVLVNELMKADAVPASAASVLAQLVHPFAPHLGEEMWELLGHPPSIQSAAWPRFDPALAVDDVVEIPVQVNGRVRGRVQLPNAASQADALAAAQADQRVSEAIAGKTLAKTIWVPGKILNLIVR